MVGAGVFASAGRAAEQTAPLSASTTIEGMPAAPQAVPIPAGRQVFYDIDQVTKVDFGHGIWRRTVAGDRMTFSLIELDSAVAKGLPPSRAHHHTYEQFIWGLSGSFDQYVGGRTGTVGPNVLTVAPPNVEHTLAGVNGPGIVTLLEVMPIVRTDLLPPRPAVTFPQTETARPVPAGSQLFAEFDKMPWTGSPGESRFKAIFGETCSFILWDLPPGTMKGTEKAGHHHDAEQISYVLAGHADARIDDQVRRIGPGTLLMIPSNVDHLPMWPVNGESLLLLDFQPVIREDLRRRMGQK